MEYNVQHWADTRSINNNALLSRLSQRVTHFITTERPQSLRLPPSHAGLALSLITSLTYSYIHDMMYAFTYIAYTDLLMPW